MIIEFLEDYCGRETAMQACKKGDRMLMSFAQAAELVRLNIAVEVTEHVEVTSAASDMPVLVTNKKSKRLRTAPADGGA